MEDKKIRVSLRIYKSQLDEIKEKAESKKLSVTDFILESCGIKILNNKTEKKELKLDEVLTRIPKKVSNGNEFSLPSLFTKQEWADFDKKSKLSVGKKFKKLVDTNSSKLPSNIKFIKKDSANLAWYKK
ncbi:MAG: single-stranded DNA-binding protein [Paeniclostridium sp.]|nr:DUF1413 domain-containing protein [Paeniclostridium sp.]MBW4863331.1 single-stranded DNA-binding protein [Paeniclostridium sp.]